MVKHFNKFNFRITLSIHKSKISILTFNSALHELRFARFIASEREFVVSVNFRVVHIVCAHLSSHKFAYNNLHAIEKFIVMHSVKQK